MEHINIVGENGREKDQLRRAEDSQVMVAL